MFEFLLSTCNKTDSIFFPKKEIEPRMHMSESDFDSITSNRTLCNKDGCIGVNEFCSVMIRFAFYFQGCAISEFQILRGVFICRSIDFFPK